MPQVNYKNYDYHYLHHPTFGLL